MRSPPNPRGQKGEGSGAILAVYVVQYLHELKIGVYLLQAHIPCGVDTAEFPYIVLQRH